MFSKWKNAYYSVDIILQFVITTSKDLLIFSLLRSAMTNSSGDVADNWNSGLHIHSYSSNIHTLAEDTFWWETEIMFVWEDQIKDIWVMENNMEEDSF